MAGHASDLGDVLAHASLTGMVTCTRAGADPPRRAELDQFAADQKTYRG